MRTVGARVVTFSVLWLLPLVSPVASAASTEPVASLEAQRLAIVGVGELAGSLRGLVVEGSTHTPTEAQLVIEASSLVVETDYRTTSATVAGLASVQEDEGSSESVHQNASLEGRLPRNEFYLAVFPRPGDSPAGLRLEVDDDHLLPYAGADLVGKVFAGTGRQEARASGTDALLHVGGAPGRELSVRGSFVLLLWEWDVEVHSDGRTTEYPSGYETRPVAADPTGWSSSVVARTVTRENYVYVESGSLTLRLPPSASRTLLLEDAEISLTGTLVLDGATGKMADGDSLRPMTASRLDIEGRLQASVRTTPHDLLATEVFGAPDRVEADGVALGWVAPIAGDSGPAAWPWLLGGALLLGSGALVGGRRVVVRRSDEALMGELDDLMARRDYAAVTERSDRLLRSRGFSKDAAVLKVEALAYEGRTDEALAIVARLDDWKGPAGAMKDYLLAYLHALRGDKRRALPHLKSCLAAAPEFRHEVARNPAFRDLRLDPSISPLLPGRGMGKAPETGYV